MRFHGLMLLRDEADILPQTLAHLLKWIDALYVLDLGSTDGTWEIVQEFARRDPRIVPFVHRPILYDDHLRSWLFDAFRDRFSPGDWICKIDADEFYPIEPPRFVEEHLHVGDSMVYLLWYYFRLTQPEVAAYESGVVDEAADRLLPIEQRRRFYQMARYSEPRLFRYRKSMRWPEHISFPYNAGYVSRVRIPVRHYPHRDISQMIRRYAVRSEVMKLNPTATGDHWKLVDWRKDILDPAASPAAIAEGVSTMEGLDTNAIQEWAPGTELPWPKWTDHLPDKRTRVLQRLIHPIALPLLDRRRPAFDPRYQPTYLSAPAQPS